MSCIPLDRTCREVVELVTDHLEARVSAEDGIRLELHLVYCDACGNYSGRPVVVVAPRQPPGSEDKTERQYYAGCPPSGRGSAIPA